MKPYIKAKIVSPVIIAKNPSFWDKLCQRFDIKKQGRKVIYPKPRNTKDIPGCTVKELMKGKICQPIVLPTVFGTPELIIPKEDKELI